MTLLLLWPFPIPTHPVSPLSHWTSTFLKFYRIQNEWFFSVLSQMDGVRLRQNIEDVKRYVRLRVMWGVSCKSFFISFSPRNPILPSLSSKMFGNPLAYECSIIFMVDGVRLNSLLVICHKNFGHPVVPQMVWCPFFYLAYGIGCWTNWDYYDSSHDLLLDFSL